jgi:HD-GYP domain-containing protein (c-di-GMP phosphodiesterase class II)
MSGSYDLCIIKKNPMTRPFQLYYPVVTLDNRELLPTGAELTQETMDNLVRSARKETLPRMRLLEYGTIAKDLLSFCEHPPYDQIFSNPKRIQRVLEAIRLVEFVTPLLDIYGFIKINAPYTYRHILTVYAMSLLLAQELLTDSTELASAVSAAPHHDIGKICVPIEIRKKTTPLTEEERHHLSHHSAAGYVLLSYYYQDSCHPAAITARDHHERRNATGYPRGVALQNRIVEIVAVGDLFDALVSQRPYRPSSYDLRSALEEITHLALTGAVCSEVVQALISLNRTGQHSYKECTLSEERRGAPPSDNLYRGAQSCQFQSSEEQEACVKGEVQKEQLNNLLLDVSD